jgi:hypothetical protein
MTIPTKDEGRAATDRATPKDTSSKPDSIAPAADTAINLRAWLIGFALDVQRADVAMIALALAGWPR